MRQLHQMRIFLASPGDVSRERKYVEEVVAELNGTVAEFRGIVLRVVSWKADAYPEYGRDAQAIINSQIAEMSNIALFVGLMWNRIGTPTPRARSGTIEEFERAAESRTRNGNPMIWFYFRSSAARYNTVETLEQRKGVLAFKKVVQENGLPWEYTTPASFRDIFRQHLIQWIVSSIPAAGPTESRSPIRSFVTKLTVWCELDIDILVDDRYITRIENRSGFDYAGARVRVTSESVLTIRAPGFERSVPFSQLCADNAESCKVRVGTGAHSDIRITKEEKDGAMRAASDANTLVRELLHNAEYLSRAWAAKMLGYQGGELAVGALTKALRDPDPWVQAQAADALGRIGDPAVLEELTAAFESYGRKESYGYIFESALKKIRFLQSRST